MIEHFSLNFRVFTVKWLRDLKFRNLTLVSQYWNRLAFVQKSCN